MTTEAPMQTVTVNGASSGASVRVQRLVGQSVHGSKSESFFARLLERRNTPGNCVRCGHKNPQPKHKTCPRCLDAVRRRKADVLKNSAPITRGEVEAMLRRIHSLETACANLQMSHNRMYNSMAMAKRRNIRQAVKEGVREIQRLDECRYADVMPTIHPQELATINHAYDRK